MSTKIQVLLYLPLLLFTACQEKKTLDAINYPQEQHDSIQTITLLFCGDVMQHQPQIQSARDAAGKDYKYKKCFQHIAPDWIDPDFVIANLETTLGNDDFSGYPCFRSPWQLARDLHELGVTTFVTSNNHCCDRQAKGIASTIHYLDSLKIPHTGTFIDTLSYQTHAPLYLEKEGFKIALLNYTYGTTGIPVPQGFFVSLIDTNIIKQDIQHARRDSATNIIAFMHWGNEYQHFPSSEQLLMGKWLHEQGVDLVIGSHPHVVQPIEYHTRNNDTTGITVYSLGNFISNQSQPGTDGGICVRLTLTKPWCHATRYHMETIKFVMHRPYEEGVRQYYVVPENQADRVLVGNQLAKSKRFFKATDSILSWKKPNY